MALKTEEIVMDNSHDRKKMLYEYRAKNTLKLIYPNEFDHLVKSEKPDWKDETKSIGVEVVRATDASALAGRNNFLKISGKNISSVSAKDIESVTKYGGNLYIDPATNIVTSHIAALDFAETMVNREFLKKVLLINDTQEEYFKLDNLFLYIICDAPLGRTLAEKLFETFDDIQQSYALKYSGVFVDDGYLLHRYSFVNKVFSTADVSSVGAGKEVSIQTIQELDNNQNVDN